MGCRLIRGETIYFVRDEGSAFADVRADCKADWYGDKIDSPLLPSVYSEGPEGLSPKAQRPVIPIEIRTFET
jgi:hypothetical protein